MNIEDLLLGSKSLTRFLQYKYFIFASNFFSFKHMYINKRPAGDGQPLHLWGGCKMYSNTIKYLLRLPLLMAQAN